VQRAKQALAQLDWTLILRGSSPPARSPSSRWSRLRGAMDVEAKLLTLDEPTSSLDERGVAELFKVIRKLRDDGIGIVFVTHFMDQVYAVTNRITVLRNG
jgi:galactofuranose transport system ATP-binding protein